LSVKIFSKLQNPFSPEVIACLESTRTYRRFRKINEEFVRSDNIDKKIKKIKTYTTFAFKT